MNEECPDECSCWIGYVIRTGNDVLLPLVSVDCRHRGLATLPATLPHNTTTLYAQGNQVTSRLPPGGGGGELWKTHHCRRKNRSSLLSQIAELTPLAEGRGNYADVKDVYLDDNAVSSVALLEGTPWLSSFRALSLRGNRLTQLPTYALQNALEKNHNALSLHLGLNPWRCDCVFTPAFQVTFLNTPLGNLRVRLLNTIALPYPPNK